jgi:ribosomal-protein-alanine N-acetyltransferase
MGLNMTGSGKRFFKNMPELSTRRLVLRRLRKTDVDDIFDYASRPVVTKYTIWDYHRTNKETKAFIKRVTEKYKHGEPVSWAVTDKRSGKVIGTAGYEFYSSIHKTAGIGYAISPDYWNKGYMTEAVKKIIEFGFKKIGLNRIEAVCDIKNIGSARVMEKAGMKFEGIQRSRIITAKGRVHDVKSYAITRKDFYK